MKIIINESQYKLIVENENKGGNLIDLTDVYESGVSPNKLDDMYEHINNKKGGKYIGYYINGDVDLEKYNVNKLNYLVIVGGRLYLRHTPIKLLPMLSYVGGSLDLYGSQIESLPDGLSVGGYLDLSDTQIKSLPMLKYVGGSLYLRYTPLSKTTTRKELRSKINVEGHIYL